MSVLVGYIENALRDSIPVSELHATALWVAEELTGLSRTEILCGKGTINLPNMEMVLARLRRQEPLQYVFGHTLWRGMDLRVTPAVLIPRPETSELVDWVLEENTADGLAVVDAGTGSGCVAIALKRERPMWSVTALDLSDEALEVAGDNAKRHATEITFLKADMLALPAALRTDIMVANPPYIAECERMDMEENVLLYEPAKALFVPDDDVLLFYRALARQRRAKRLYFEINSRYGREVVAMLCAEGYRQVELRQDMQGKDRMVRALL